MEDIEKALEYYKKSLPIRRESNDKRGIALTLIYMGQIYIQKKEYEAAEQCLREALDLSRSISFAIPEAAALQALGDLAHSRGKQAAEYYRQALRITQKAGNSLGQRSILRSLARSEVAAGNLKEALKHIEQAIERIEFERRNITAPEMRTQFQSNIWEYYTLYIDILMRLHLQDMRAGYDKRALEASEQGRGLLELLVGSSLAKLSGLDSTLIERDMSARAKIRKADMMLQKAMGGNNAEQVAEAAKQLKELLEEKNQIRDEIRRLNPRFAAYIDPQPLRLEQIQQLLDEKTLLLSYVLGESRGYLWVVSREGLQSYQLPPKAEIERLARTLYAKLIRPEKLQRGLRLSLEATTGYRKDATELFKMLLEPASGELGDKRLLIVADGALQYIPFAVLSAENGRMLMDNHSLIHLQSASMLGLLRSESRPKEYSKTLAVFADPVFSSGDKRLGVAESGAVRNLQIVDQKALDAIGSIPRLPFTRVEAERLSKMVGKDKVLQALDFDASTSKVLSTPLTGYRYIHFATHGYIDSERSDLSALLLSMYSSKGEAIDGFLRLEDIYSLKLPVEMVVLSACETALGQNVVGEGLIGLTRGFMYAGAERLLVSLWPVHDEATAEMMLRFYNRLLKHKESPAEALRFAQLEMRTRTRFKAPYYWAAFVLQGEYK